MNSDGIETDPQQQEKLKNLWKLFGRETKAGKELFSLYGVAEKPKINYPKVRPKTQKQIDQEKERMVSTKKCPQKTQIQYPQVIAKKSHNFHPIDFVPKRKNESVIRKEIEQYYRRRALEIPANRGVDRKELVRKLQERFKVLSGGLPKGAQLPGLNQIKLDEQLIKQNAKLKYDKKFKNYKSQVKKQNQTTNKKSQKQQLNDLFDAIVAEIDERQQYLDSIDHLDQPKIKERIKNQMIERVAELQKLTQLKKNQE